MKKKFYEKNWFIVLMAIFIPPIGLFLLLFKKKEMNKILKIFFVFFLSLYSLIWLVFILTDTEATENAGSNSIAATTDEVSTNNILVENTTKEIYPTKNEETTTVVSSADASEIVLTTKNTTKTTVEPTEKLTEKPTQRPTEKPAEKVTEIKITKDPDETITVYRTKTGKSYHYENPCGNGTYYAVSLADAKRAGLSPCGKCVLH